MKNLTHFLIILIGLSFWSCEAEEINTLFEDVCSHGLEIPQCNIHSGQELTEIPIEELIVGRWQIFDLDSSWNNVGVDHNLAHFAAQVEGMKFDIQIRTNDNPLQMASYEYDLYEGGGDTLDVYRRGYNSTNDNRLHRLTLTNRHREATPGRIAGEFGDSTIVATFNLDASIPSINHHEIHSYKMFLIPER